VLDVLFVQFLESLLTHPPLFIPLITPIQMLTRRHPPIVLPNHQPGPGMAEGESISDRFLSVLSRLYDFISGRLIVQYS
jgi:hypothetical protein